MRYDRVVEGRFLSRPNRFIALVEIDGRQETVHVKNTGRCRELLLPDVKVWLSDSGNPNRKTRYDLIAVEKARENGETVLINIDSQIPNDVAGEWLPKSKLFSENAKVRREVTFGASRFDFYIEDGERKCFLEVKGVTLEREGVALFPDAPTERGVKHLGELAECVEQGYEAYLLFVIQMKGVCELRPNDETHKAFGDALRQAESRGVRLLAMDCIVAPDSLKIDKPIEIKIKG